MTEPQPSQQEADENEASVSVASSTRRRPTHHQATATATSLDTKYHGDERAHRLANEIYKSYLRLMGWKHFPGFSQNYLYVPGSLLRNRPKNKRLKTWLKESGVPGVHYANGDTALCDMLRDYGIHHAPRDTTDFPIPRTGRERYTLDELIDEYKKEVGEAAAAAPPAQQEETSATSSTGTNEVSAEETSRAVAVAPAAAALPCQESPAKSFTAPIPKSLVKELVNEMFGDETISRPRMWKLGDVFKGLGDDMLHGEGSPESLSGENTTSISTGVKRKLHHSSSPTTSDREGKKKSKSSVHRSNSRCITPTNFNRGSGAGVASIFLQQPDKLDQLKSQLDAKDSELEAMSKLLEDTNKKMNNLKAEKELFEEHSGQLKSQLEAKEVQIKLLEVERDNLEEEKDCFEEQVFRLGLQVEGGEIEVETADKQVKKLEHQVETLKIKLDEKNDTINKWREKLECLKEENKKDSEEKETEKALLVDKLRQSKAAHAREVQVLRKAVKNATQLPLTNLLHSNSSDEPTEEKGQEKGTEEMEALRNEIRSIARMPNVTTSDVGGMQGVKKALFDAIILPKKSAQRPGLVMLYGPPGTGKTHIVQAVANRARCTLYPIKASDIGCKWIGQSEKKVTLLFEEARKHDYAIIFIDEIDGICSNRDSNPDENDRKVLTSFLTEINSIGEEVHNVSVICATNKPWDLDSALLDRFDTKIYSPLPDLQTRKSILELQMNNREHSLTGANFHRLAVLTEEATAREVKKLAVNACKQACRDSKDGGETFRLIDGKYTPVSPCDSCREQQEGHEIGENTTCQFCGAVSISPYDLPDGSLKPRSVQVGDFKKHLKTYCSVTDEMKQQYEDWQSN